MVAVKPSFTTTCLICLKDIVWNLKSWTDSKPHTATYEAEHECVCLHSHVEPRYVLLNTEPQSFVCRDCGKYWRTR